MTATKARRRRQQGKLRAARVLGEGGGCGLRGMRALGRRFYRAARVPGRVGSRSTRRGMAPGAGRTRTRVRVGLGEEDSPDRWAPPVSERKEGRRERRGRTGPGKETASWAARGKEKRKEGKGTRASWVGEKESEADWAGPCGEKRRERRRPVGLGRKEEKEGGKEKKERRRWAGPKVNKRKKKKCI
jgi:hypothetical protein